VLTNPYAAKVVAEQLRRRAMDIDTEDQTLEDLLRQAATEIENR